MLAASGLANAGEVVESSELAPKENDAVNEEMQQLEGTWSIVALEVGGKAMDPLDLTDSRLVFEGNRCDLVSGKRRIGCTFTVDPGKTPKWIDVTRTTDKVSWPGIYELKDGNLKVFLDTTGGKRPTEFKTKDGTKQVIRTYMRIKP